METLSLLLVEDNIGDAKLMQAALSKVPDSNMDLQHVTTLEAAKEQLREKHYDVVLLDLFLPDASGLEALEEVVTTSPLSANIVLTGLSDQSMGMRALQMGAADYVVKGSERSHLARSIRYSVERRKILNKIIEVDALRSKFVDTAAHEIRTPVAIIREFASLIQDSVCGPINPQQMDSLDVIIRNCDRLVELLNNLLDLKKLQSGATRRQRGKCDVREILCDCVRDFSIPCQSKHQAISLRCEDALPAVLADKSLIDQVVVNLIGNAYKFTKIGGEIVVRGSCRGSKVFIEVCDNGCGIEESMLSTIFEAFSQAKASDSSGVKGSGLGLAISRSILELHGSRIHVSSTLGEGSCFSFELEAWDELEHLRAHIEDALHNNNVQFGCIVAIRPIECSLSEVESRIRPLLRSQDELLLLEDRRLCCLFVVDDIGLGQALAERIQAQGGKHCHCSAIRYSRGSSLEVALGQAG